MTGSDYYLHNNFWQHDWKCGHKCGSGLDWVRYGTVHSAFINTVLGYEAMKHHLKNIDALFGKGFKYCWWASGGRAAGERRASGGRAAGKQPASSGCYCTSNKASKHSEIILSIWGTRSLRNKHLLPLSSANNLQDTEIVEDASMQCCCQG